MSPKVIDRENKRQEILMAAIHVFARKGISNSKIADIASAAGIGKGTVYEYFRSKEEIFYESFRYFIQKTDLIVADHTKDIHEPALKLEAWIEGWLGAISGSLDFVAIMMDYWAEGIRSRKEDAIFNMEKLYEEYRKKIKKMIDEGIKKGVFKPVNSRITAAVLIGALDGLMLQWIMNPSMFSPKEVSANLKKTFLAGLLVEKN